MRSKALWLAGFVGTLILLLGVRAFLDPVAASASFGLPMHTDDETAFVRIWGAKCVARCLALILAARGMGSSCWSSRPSASRCGAIARSTARRNAALGLP